MRVPALLLVLAFSALPLVLSGCGSEPAVAADCQCAEGQAGEPVWCAACKKGWVDGEKAHCRGCVEKAVKARMKANAQAKGLPTGAAFDDVVAKAAIALAQEPPKCACSGCESNGECTTDDGEGSEAESDPAADSDAPQPDASTPAE